jgi:hypothetical protein
LIGAGAEVEFARGLVGGVEGGEGEGSAEEEGYSDEEGT